MKAGTRSAIRILLAITALGTLAFAASPADAAKKKSKPAKLKVATGTASATTFPNQAIATATCPGGTKAVSGGYTTSVPQTSGVGSHWLNVFESQRVGDNAWRASGVEDFGAPATDTITAIAYCQKIGKVTTSSSTVALPVPAGTSTPAQASCPAGKKLLSGGFATKPENNFGGNMITRSSAVSKTAWQVDTFTLTPPDHGSTTVFAYCAKVAKLALRTTTVTAPAGVASTATTPKCPKKTTARAGGFEALPGGVQSGEHLYDTHRVGKTWTTAAAPGGPAVSGTLTAQALCRA